MRSLADVDAASVPDAMSGPTSSEVGPITASASRRSSSICLGMKRKRARAHCTPLPCHPYRPILRSRPTVLLPLHPPSLGCRAKPAKRKAAIPSFPTYTVQAFPSCQLRRFWPRRCCHHAPCPSLSTVSTANDGGVGGCCHPFGDCDARCRVDVRDLPDGAP